MSKTFGSISFWIQLSGRNTFTIPRHSCYFMLMCYTITQFVTDGHKRHWVPEAQQILKTFNNKFCFLLQGVRVIGLLSGFSYWLFSGTSRSNAKELRQALVYIDKHVLAAKGSERGKLLADFTIK